MSFIANIGASDGLLKNEQLDSSRLQKTAVVVGISDGAITLIGSNPTGEVKHEACGNAWERPMLNKGL